MDPNADDLQRRIVQVSALAAIVLLISAREAILLCASRFDKVPQHTSMLSGQDWINELVDGHDGQFYNKFGMHKHVFRSLLFVLWRDVNLHNTRDVLDEEQLAIFLYFARRGASNRALQEQFQRSGDTILM